MAIGGNTDGGNTPFISDHTSKTHEQNSPFLSSTSGSLTYLNLEPKALTSRALALEEPEVRWRVPRVPKRSRRDGDLVSGASVGSPGLPVAYGMHVYVCLCLTLYSDTRCISTMLIIYACTIIINILKVACLYLFVPLISSNLYIN